MLGFQSDDIKPASIFQVKCQVQATQFSTIWKPLVKEGRVAS
jgi:hypothetical protein